MKNTDSWESGTSQTILFGGMRRSFQRFPRHGVLAYAILALGTLLVVRECYAQIHRPPHVLLGVALNTKPAELKRAYRKRCLELHPDKHKGEANKAWAEQEFMALGKAYETMLAEAVRRYQGASSRPTRAGAGADANSEDGKGPSGGQQQQSRQADDSRQTSADRERADRHRRERERRAAGRRAEAWPPPRDRGGGQSYDRSSADMRRQREREREFRRLQEEERRWQEQARKRQEQARTQQQQHFESQKQEARFASGGGSGDSGGSTSRSSSSSRAEDEQLRAERLQLEREERHRREVVSMSLVPTSSLV
jgi:curved DNA-binding protein CbpA